MGFERIKDLTTKSINTIKEEGVGAFVSKSTNYIRTKTSRKKSYVFKDVLFINGCTLPHPTRYRVDHQIEQLEANNMSAARVNYDKLDIKMLKYYRSFIFFRCPITPVIEEFIKRAKEENKTIFFDIDDLVIDQKYTDTIKYLKALSLEELSQYNDGVNRMRETLLKCDYAITTTKRLSLELKNYIKEVYINRNVASEKMTELSLDALGTIKKDDSKIVMGYLSGSITHNDDFKLIMGIIKRLMSEHNNLYLKVVGLLNIPDELIEYKDRIIKERFVLWMKLPSIIASLNINLAPLEESIFNEAKSENKWVEASLCKVVTVASNTGAFKEAIKDEETGLLCNNEEEWYEKLNKVIIDEEYRRMIGLNAYNEVIKNNITTYTGFGLAEFVTSKLKPNICFVLPSTNISGGVNVVIKHSHILKKNGYQVTIINMDEKDDDIINSEGSIGVVSITNTDFAARIHNLVATLWATLDFVYTYPNVKNRSYLVQNFETDFSPFGSYLRIKANATYNSFTPINYLTISKWCQAWLKDKFKKGSKYAPNGIKLEQFPYRKRTFKDKIKILIEGNSEDYYKNVDESFKIVDKLDKNKFEIHFLSYQGEPKEWYHVDKFMHKVPYDEVGKVYSNCDILIKSSILESFSYPPLEMMATGGISLVAPNSGNIEYLRDEYNCLFYEVDNINMAIKQIDRIINDKELRDKLIKNGLETAKERSWDKIETKIIKLYSENE
jgi:glycosyltransferase involved in cell wall biosynthesis